MLFDMTRSRALKKIYFFMLVELEADCCSFLCQQTWSFKARYGHFIYLQKWTKISDARVKANFDKYRRWTTLGLLNRVDVASLFDRFRHQ